MNHVVNDALRQTDPYVQEQQEQSIAAKTGKMPDERARLLAALFIVPTGTPKRKAHFEGFQMLPLKTYEGSE